MAAAAADWDVFFAAVEIRWLANLPYTYVRRIPGTWFTWPFTTKVNSLWPQAADSHFGIQLSNTSRCVELERVKLHYRSANCVSYNPFSGQNDQIHLMMRYYRSKKCQKNTHTKHYYRQCLQCRSPSIGCFNYSLEMASCSLVLVSLEKM